MKSRLILRCASLISPGLVEQGWMPWIETLTGHPWGKEGRPRSRNCRNTAGRLAAPGKEELESALEGLQVVKCIIQIVVLSTICFVTYLGIQYSCFQFYYAIF